MRSILESEFEKNVNQPGSIMRANCVASKISGDYSRKRSVGVTMVVSFLAAIFATNNILNCRLYDDIDD